MPELIDFPEPTLIPVNGVELEVFEAGQENAGNPSCSVTAGQSTRSHGATRCPPLPQPATTSSSRTSGATATHPGRSTSPTTTSHTCRVISSRCSITSDTTDATFVGHDWGANVVWGLTLLHPDRVTQVINLSLPYQERGEQPWIELMEAGLR